MIVHTHTHFGRVSSHQHIWNNLGICNIDVFPLLLLLFYSSWLQKKWFRMVKRNLYVLLCSLSKLSVSTTDLPSSLQSLLLRCPLEWFPTSACTCKHMGTHTLKQFIKTIMCIFKCKVASHILALFVTSIRIRIGNVIIYKNFNLNVCNMTIFL